MTDTELFYRITTDPKILFYHDQLALLDWKVTVCVRRRKIVFIKSQLGNKKQPRHVTLLKRYLKLEYGITNNN